MLPTPSIRDAICGAFRTQLFAACLSAHPDETWPLVVQWYCVLCRVTNMRMMEGYGFVMPGGNPADRVSLPLIENEG